MKRKTTIASRQQSCVHLIWLDWFLSQPLDIRAIFIHIETDQL